MKFSERGGGEHEQLVSSWTSTVSLSVLSNSEESGSVEGATPTRKVVSRSQIYVFERIKRKNKVVIQFEGRIEEEDPPDDRRGCFFYLKRVADRPVLSLIL